MHHASAPAPALAEKEHPQAGGFQGPTELWVLLEGPSHSYRVSTRKSQLPTSKSTALVGARNQAGGSVPQWGEPRSVVQSTRATT
jgi:hypothetical protein